MSELPDGQPAALNRQSLLDAGLGGLSCWAGEDNIVEFGLAMAGREHIEPFASSTASAMLENLEDLAASIQTLVAEPDRVALSGPIGRWWADGIGVSFSAGAEGWIDDDLAFVKPFGFEINAISAPTLIFHGRLDLFVPVSHGGWHSRAIPDAESWILEDEAHLSLLINQVGNIHAWLLGHL